MWLGAFRAHDHVMTASGIFAMIIPNASVWRFFFCPKVYCKSVRAHLWVPRPRLFLVLVVIEVAGRIHSLISILVAVMNFHPSEAMAVRSTGWCLDGVGPYLEPLLEWTTKFRFGLGGRKAISKETNPALLRDADGRPRLRDTKFEAIHVTLLGADRARVECVSFGSGSTVPIRGGQYQCKNPNNRRNNKAKRIALIPGRRADEIVSRCSGNGRNVQVDSSPYSSRL